MAHVGFLYARLAAALFAALPAPQPRPAEGRGFANARARVRHFMKILLVAFAIVGLTSCETMRHQFAGPALDWQARNGQLLYHGRKTTLIGEVLVRFSKAGDLEL